MQIQQQTIECVRCGLTREDLLTEEESEKLTAAVGPIHRHCAQCGTMTGWISSRRSPGGTKKSPPHPSPTQTGGGSSTDGPTLKGQERMATQAERDHVNSLADDKARSFSKG
jgi:hypothetical protein